jgi:preprotein translocase subunit SecD
MRKPLHALLVIAFVAVLSPANAVAQEIDVADPGTPLLQIRVTQEEVGAGMQQMELSGDVLFVASEAVVDDSHIEFLRATRTATGLQLRVQFTEEGASRLQQTTRSQIGKRLGLLVGSRLVSAPMVRSEIGGLPSRRAVVALPLAENEVDSVLAAFEARFDEGVLGGN